MKQSILRDGRRVGVLLGQRIAALGEPILEGVGERDDAHAGRRLQDIPGRAGATSAAADQAHPNLVAAGGIGAHEAVQPRGDGGRHGRGGGVPDEVTARRAALLFAHLTSPVSLPEEYGRPTRYNRIRAS